MTSEATYPAAEQPADDDRTNQGPPPGNAPRYSASASVPVPPPLAGQPEPYAGPAAQAAPFGESFGQPFGQPQPTQPPTGQPPVAGPTSGAGQPSATGHARVAASASVPVPPPSGQGPGTYVGPVGAPSYVSPGGPGAGGPGQVGRGQGAPPQGGPTHGGPGQGYPGQGASGQAVVPTSPPAIPTYGGPPQGYPSQPGTYGQAGGPGQFGGYGPPGPPPGGPGGAGGPGAPGTTGHGSYQPGYPAASPGSEPGRSGASEKMVPTGGWPYAEQASKRPRGRRGLLITLIVLGALILIGGAGGIGWALTHRGSPYEMGTCVTKDATGTGATVVDCGTAGAFRITSIVDNESKCPDPASPVLVLTGGGKGREVACLAKAS